MCVCVILAAVDQRNHDDDYDDDDDDDDDECDRNESFYGYSWAYVRLSSAYITFVAAPFA